MAYNYVVTAQRPTAVNHSLMGKFLSEKESNLVLVKGNRLIFYKCIAGELKLELDVALNGQVACIEKLRHVASAQDLLFVLTERSQYCLLGYDSEKGTLTDRGSGRIVDRIGRETEVGKLCAVDPDGRVIVAHIYEGVMQIIPVDSKGNLKSAFCLPIDVINIIDMKFLNDSAKPILAVIHGDGKDVRNLRTFMILAKEKSIKTGTWMQSNIEAQASRIVAVTSPIGGALVIGQISIGYYSGTSTKVIPIAQNKITAVGELGEEGGSYFISDVTGGLRIVILIFDSEKKFLTNLYLETLGVTSCGSTISYLGDGLVYIGSCSGDCMIVKLSEEPDQDNSYIRAIETYPNIGPILDMCLVDFDKQGQSQAILCSGCHQDGSLRVIRNGIGIKEQASIDLEGIKDIWSLRESTSSTFDKYLVQSFFSETRILVIEGTDMEEIEVEGFLEGRTLFCGNVVGDMIVQVTSNGCVLLDSRTFEAVNEMIVPGEQPILIATANSRYLALGCKSGILYLLEVLEDEKILVQKCKVEMPHEIACLSLNPIANTAITQDNEPKSKSQSMQKNAKKRSALALQLDSFLAVGLWTDMSVRLLDVNDNLHEICKVIVSGDIQARSVVMVTLGMQHQLLVGLGDGHVITYHIDYDEMNAIIRKNVPRKVALGTKPIGLNCFVSNGTACVFVTGDRPTILFSRGTKIQYSSVNITEVHSVCSFHSQNFPDCLALSDEETLTIGTIDEIQRLHIRTIELGQQPRKIAHHEQARLFGLITSDNSTNIVDGYIRFLDDSTFDEIYHIPLGRCEKGMSIAVVPFKGLDYKLFVVGTAFVKSDEFEPFSGRIIAFGIAEDGPDRKITHIAEISTDGAVYTLQPFQDGFVAGINRAVKYYGLKESESGSAELTLLGENEGFVIALYLQTKDDLILVGDLMRSISVLKYQQEEAKLVEVGMDYSGNWMTAVEILDNGCFLGAENNCNLFTAKRNTEASTVEEKFRLDVVGEYHLGEFVNVFREGSLVMQPVDSEHVRKQCGIVGNMRLYGALSGAIGCIIPLSKQAYDYFMRLQRNMVRAIDNIGNLSHGEWRAFCNQRQIADARNFVDGDVIETFPDLPRKQQEKILKYILDEIAGEALPLLSEASIDSITRDSLPCMTKDTAIEDIELLIEDMMRMH